MKSLSKLFSYDWCEFLILAVAHLLIALPVATMVVFCVTLSIEEYTAFIGEYPSALQVLKLCLLTTVGFLFWVASISFCLILAKRIAQKISARKNPRRQEVGGFMHASSSSTDSKSDAAEEEDKTPH